MTKATNIFFPNKQNERKKEKNKQKDAISDKYKNKKRHRFVCLYKCYIEFLLNKKK